MHYPVSTHKRGFLTQQSLYVQSVISVSSFGTYFKSNHLSGTTHAEKVIWWSLKTQITSHYQHGNVSFYNSTWTALPQEGM